MFMAFVQKREPRNKHHPVYFLNTPWFVLLPIFKSTRFLNLCAVFGPMPRAGNWWKWGAVSR